MDNIEKDNDDSVLKIRRFIAFLAVFLVLIGEYIIFALPIENVPIPSYFWISLVGIVLFLLSQAIRPSALVQKLSSRLSFSGGVPWIIAAVLFSGLATLTTSLFQTYSRTNYIPVTTVWLGTGLCYITAFHQGFWNIGQWKDWFRENWKELAAIALVTLAAASLRFYHLGSIPRVLDGDEGRMGLTAQTTVNGDFSNPFALWENFGGFYLQAINLMFRFFGATPFALRLLPAISGVMAIPVIYLLARLIAGKRIALITAILLAFSHTHLHFSQIASVGYIHDAWLVPMELYLLLSGLDKRSTWRTAAGGVLLAVHFVIYLTAQIVVGLVLVFMLLAFLFLRTWFRPALRQALAFWSGYLIMILPESMYVWQHPNEFFNRLGENGTFQSGWLVGRMATTGMSAIRILAGRVAHTFLSLIYYPATDFYGSSMPPLSLFAAALFLIGLAIILFRVKSPFYLLLNGYFWALILAIGIFAIPPSADSYRTLTALPAAMLIAAIGFDQILNVLGMGWSTSRPGYSFVAISIIAAIIGLNMWTYYGDFVGQCRYGENLQGRFASFLGSYVATVQNESQVYLLSNDTYFYGSHASVDFLDHQRPITNINEPIDSLNLVSGETVIASPERINELETWARAHPGGQLHYRYDCTNTILLAYQVP